MEQSFRSSGGEEWRKYAGVPPMYYPTHSTAMILSTMPGVYAKKVAAFGFENSPRTDIYGHDGQNIYDNAFSNTAMLLKLSNGGIARISENRCVGWKAPETYISQFYGSEGCYDFSFARATFTHWQGGEEHPNAVIAKDVTKEIQPEDLIVKDKFGREIELKELWWRVDAAFYVEVHTETALDFFNEASHAEGMLPLEQGLGIYRYDECSDFWVTPQDDAQKLREQWSTYNEEIKFTVS
jgi:hypothetical protein